jgi:tetratricopeptide (TPR) repeat protein
MPARVWISAALAGLVIALYAKTGAYGYVAYDDWQYVLKNEHVRAGLTPQGLRWAFNIGYAGNWHPLTWISHMIDCELHGDAPGGHHWTNVLLHALNAVVLFLVLQWMAGELARPAFVAALFALHPLRVESVAWIAERKDLLSGLFALLAIAVHAAYARRPSAARYLLVALAFSLGLAAKPMLVTLPLVLLLVDVWPLGRLSPWSWSTAARLAVEKAPLLALSAASCWLTFLAQHAAGAVIALEAVPFGHRLSNALVAYVVYIGKMLWPVGLAIPYPVRIWSTWAVLGSALFLAAFSLAALRGLRPRPWLFVGWFWYLGMLVPVIGLVQVGHQAFADRYTYLPQVGLCIALVWGASELWARWGLRQRNLAFAGAAAVLLCAALTWAQIEHWRNPFALFAHTLEVTGDNYTAHKTLGIVHGSEGNLEAAEQSYRKALALRPELPDALINLARLLTRQGRLEEAIALLRKVPAEHPEWKAALPAVYCQLGTDLESKDEPEKAVEVYRELIRLRPDYYDSHFLLGRLLGRLQRYAEAVVPLETAVRLRPRDGEAAFVLAGVYLGLGNREAALAQYERLQSLDPEKSKRLKSFLE